MTRGHRALVDAVAAALIAVGVFVAFGHSFLNYDSFYSLVWGSDLLAGREPQYDVSVAPTPHPLAIAVGAVLSPLGDSAEDALLAIVLLSLGAIGVGLFRLGKELYAWPVGLLAAAIFLTRVPVLNFGIRGYVDLPTIALIVWAAVLEARRPRSGPPVLALLALAGLLRPEAWLFAAAYWLWMAPACNWEVRLRLASLAAVAPILWSLSDLLVTGDPLWSLRGTTNLAAELGRQTGLGAAVEILPLRLGEIMRLPELIAAVLGLAAGMVWLRRQTLLPAAVAVLNGIAFVVFAIVELPLLGRYLLLAGAMLAVFAAVAALGWLAPGVPEATRRSWRVAGILLLAAFAVFTPAQAARVDDLRDDIAQRDQIQADLHDLVRGPEAATALRRCGTLFVPNHRPVPSLAYWTDSRPRDIVSAQLERPTSDGLYLAPATSRVERLSILDPRDPKRLDAEVPDGYRLSARNRSWLLYAGCRSV